MGENENPKLMGLMKKQHELLGQVIESLENIDKRLKKIEGKKA